MKKLLTILLILLFQNVYSQGITREIYKPIFLSNKTILHTKTVHVYMSHFSFKRDAHIAYIDSGSNMWPYLVEDTTKYVSKDKKWIFKSKEWDLVGQPIPIYFQSPMDLINYMSIHGYEFKTIMTYIEKYEHSEELWSIWEFERIDDN